MNETESIIRYEWMKQIGRQAGQIALRYFDQSVTIQQKSDLSPVTIADQESESFLREKILSRFPEDGLLGEEFGEKKGSNRFRWVIDPIDGTRNFIRNIPIWATLISLEYEENPVSGICYIPVWNQLYHAHRNYGAYREDKKIRVSSCSQLGESLLSYSSIEMFTTLELRQGFESIRNKMGRSRGFCDFYGFVLLAQGSVDVMIDYGVHRWDISALKVIVEEAGGTFTDWQGQQGLDKKDVLATNGVLFPTVLEILQKLE